MTRKTRTLLTGGVLAGALALSACHLPTYGGLTERNEIGCRLRGGTYTWISSTRLICVGEFRSRQSCHEVLAIDPRFDGGQIIRVCDTSSSAVWGEEGFISDGH